MPKSSRLYFKQIAAGKMANYVYLIGDTDSRECVVVDPAWDIQAVVDLAAADDMKIVGALVTHYHPDHVGGNIFGLEIEGIQKLLEINPVKIWCNKHEAEGLKTVTGASDSDLTQVVGGDTMTVGDVEITFLHTPGHTPGSQCFIVDGRLVSGDTLFVGGCVRVDLPGGNPEDLYYSLTQKLAALPKDTVLYPGHAYGPATSTIGAELETNQYLTMPSLEHWLQLMG